MVYKVAFIGAQTGDEGKGVRTVYYTQKALGLGKKSFDSDPYVLTVRWQGGANAGHTVIINDEKYALHQIPSSVLLRGTYNLMGQGTFIEPRRLLREINTLREAGIEVSPRNFGIASNAHVTLDYHLDEDTDASKATDGSHTSTGTGNKPTAVDKVRRVGIRFEEFLNRKGVMAALERRFPIAPPEPHSSLENLADSYRHEMEALAQFSVLQEDVLTDPKYRFVIGEGAQGGQLDVDIGLYPGVTSSNPGIVPFPVDKRVGVVKLYESSIGADRPFIGRMREDLEARMRDPWSERGTTTKKDRNLGWLDIVSLRHIIKATHLDCLVSTCGDRIEDLAKEGEPIKLVIAYEIDGERYEKWDKSFSNRVTLERAKPIFEDHEAWTEFFDKKANKLTPKAQAFVNRVEELTEIKFVAHGYGRGVNDIFEVEDILTV